MDAVAKEGTPETRRGLADALTKLSSALASFIESLKGGEDGPIGQAEQKTLSELATAVRLLVADTPPSATGSTEKRMSVWPEDIADASQGQPTWGYDPEVLRHG